jgi:hypothetical protein
MISGFVLVIRPMIDPIMIPWLIFPILVVALRFRAGRRHRLEEALVHFRFVGLQRVQGVIDWVPGVWLEDRQLSRVPHIQFTRELFLHVPDVHN